MLNEQKTLQKTITLKLFNLIKIYFNVRYLEKDFPSKLHCMCFLVEGGFKWIGMKAFALNQISCSPNAVQE